MAESNHTHQQIAKRPSRGKGQRDLDCPRYDECLSFAANRHWPSFNCEGCSQEIINKVLANHGGVMKPGNPQKDKLTNVDSENTKLCACGKPTIRPNSKLCASCMGKLAHKTKKPAEKAVKPAKTKTEGYEPQKSTSSAQRQADEACSVDFREYASVLSEIEKLAKEEVRPINYQIIHMLKQQLEIKKLPKGTTPT